MSSISITSSTLPSGFCPLTDAQWQILVSLLTGELSTNVLNINRGNTEPTPENRGDPWLRYNTDGTPDKLYVYYNGAWISKHPTAPGTVAMYQGTESSITTFDGGESGSVTSTSGPMWEKVTALNAKFPIGPGTLANGDIITLGTSGGVDEVALSHEQIAPHYHGVGAGDPGEDDGGFIMRNWASTGGAFQRYSIHGNLNDQTGPESFSGGNLGTSAGLATANEAEAHTNMPPYYPIWFIVKSARTFYRL